MMAEPRHQKDSKRFPDQSGWGYAEFVSDAAGDEAVKSAEPRPLWSSLSQEDEVLK